MKFILTVRPQFFLLINIISSFRITDIARFFRVMLNSEIMSQFMHYCYITAYLIFF